MKVSERVTKALFDLDHEDLNFIWSHREPGGPARLRELWWSLVRGPTGCVVAFESRVDVAIYIVAPEALIPISRHRLVS